MIGFDIPTMLHEEDVINIPKMYSRLCRYVVISFFLFDLGIEQ